MLKFFSHIKFFFSLVNFITKNFYLTQFPMVMGPCVIRPFHFQFRKKMKFYFLFVLFINSSRFFETKLPYCRKRTDNLTTKLKILLYLTKFCYLQGFVWMKNRILLQVIKSTVRSKNWNIDPFFRFVLSEGRDGVNWQLTNGQNFNWQLTNSLKFNWQLTFVKGFTDNWQKILLP